ncbi:unnamed protein product [Urochloa decumbens]|uniref:PLATZ transcription factor family protein n=1 Tax=Urochloa decumbens TaxID=240449 RepID=A0ABC9EJZ1_9POAL
MRAVRLFLVAAITVLSLSLPRDVDATSMPSMKEMALADAARVPPAWLKPLLDTKYFEECLHHKEPHRFFCTVCPGQALCNGCLPNHPDHQVIQIRKLSGHGVVRVSDVEALLDMSGVQPYLLNGHHVVFLNKRRMAGQGRAGEVRCEECERALLDVTSRFCSVGCKGWFAILLTALPEDLDFTISFTVRPKSDSESETSESYTSSGGDSDEEGEEAGTSAASKLQKTVAAEPSSRQLRRQTGVPKN